jgi:hypothetical protein
MDCGEKQKRGPFEAVERPKSREETPKEGCGVIHCMNHAAPQYMAVRRTKINSLCMGSDNLRILL